VTTAQLSSVGTGGSLGTAAGAVRTAASPMEVEDLRARVEKALDVFLGRQGPVVTAISGDLVLLLDALSDLLRSGKRMRPAFCYWGWRGAGGADAEEIVAAASALELLHACALIHDDVMDGSDTRRGQPAAHRRFAEMHRGNSWSGSSDRFGTGAAILLGDLCLSWADEALFTSRLPAEALLRAKPVFDVMRTELMAGQTLDLLESVSRRGSLERVMRVVRYKAAKYTVERPLHLGAVLADAPVALLETYSAYGLPLGEAFQLRDDVLGVFGDPAETGKPAGDDLREGKHTVLVTTALKRADPPAAALIRRLVGDPWLDDDGVSMVRDVLCDTGALAQVEQMIDRLTAQAVDALAAGPVAEPARDVLGRLAVAATARSD
jgi:geranylgeranyl diphosphate synthase type I